MSVRLFVGNLPYSANEAEIREHFGAAGEPSQIVIPVDRETGRVRGFAFVDYEEREVAERAIQALDGRLFKGRPLSVSEARARDARPPVRDARPPASGPTSLTPPFQPGGTPRPDREHSRNFGPNKAPRRHGAGSFSRRQQSERGARGPLKERLSGRMFSVEDDMRYAGAEEDDAMEMPDAVVDNEPDSDTEQQDE